MNAVLFEPDLLDPLMRSPFHHTYNLIKVWNIGDHVGEEE